MTTEPQPKRRRPGRALAIILGVVVVLAVALVVLDTWARQQVAAYVTDKVQEVLDLDSDEPVDVEVGGFSVLAQLATGRFEQLDVGVDTVTIGDLTGGVSLRAEGVPIDTTKPVETVQVEFTVGEESLQSIAHSVSSAAIDRVELVGDEVRFGTQFSLFGISIDIGIGVEPFADNGAIGFTPTSVELNGSRSSVEELAKQFGPAADALLGTRSICVAEWLPKSVTLEDVEVKGKTLVVTLGADGVLLDESALATLGSCG